MPPSPLSLLAGFVDQQRMIMAWTRIVNGSLVARAEVTGADK